MTTDDLRHQIDTIPGADGWWHEDNADTFHDIASQLIERGWTVNDAIDLLTSAYCAVANEHGN